MKISLIIVDNFTCLQMYMYVSSLSTCTHIQYMNNHRMILVRAPKWTMTPNTDTIKVYSLQSTN